MDPSLVRLYFHPSDEHNESDDQSVVWSKDAPMRDVLFQDILDLLSISPELVRSNADVGALGSVLTMHIQISALSRGITESLIDFPALTISCLNAAVHTVLGIRPHRRVQVRVHSMTQQTPLKLLKSTSVDKFVSITGNVVRVGNVKQIVTTLEFICVKCGVSTHSSLHNGRYQEPSSCSEPRCHSQRLKPNIQTATTIDWQKLRIQEVCSNWDDPGCIPRTIDCELTNDLVDTIRPGDVITVCGIIRARKTHIPGTNNETDRSVFVLYMDVNSLMLSGFEPRLHKQSIDFMHIDLESIRAVHSSTNLFKLLVNSICPGLYGQEFVKAGLCLALFGGTTRSAGGLAKRGHAHVIIVGDPDLGKSQLLRSAASIAPRGVYVCGNTTSTAGLTVSMVKDGGLGDYSLEAGALVLADQGTCCIDEFDKMSANHNAFLEAMEHQSISIAKTGVLCSLPTRTSILAASNPVGGHYNRSKTVTENIKINPTLLSRFDLIYILEDRPDEFRDRVLSEHVISLHSGIQDNSNPRGLGTTGIGGFSCLGYLKLSEYDTDNFEALPPDVFRRYIAYSKHYVHPVLDSDAKQALGDFYLELRTNYQSIDGTPITTRQLESMIRLCEARARCELREVATLQDAEEVIEITKESLYDAFREKRPIERKSPIKLSVPKQMKHFMEAVKSRMEMRGSKDFTEEQLHSLIKEVNLQVVDFRVFVDRLHQKGFLLKRGTKLYRVL